MSEISGITHSCQFVVPTTHPALPGHFPGAPLVPGVVIIDRILDVAEDWLGRRLVTHEVPQVKFVAPLRPGERADVELTLAGARLGFIVLRDGHVLSRGTLLLQDAIAS